MIPKLTYHSPIKDCDTQAMQQCVTEWINWLLEWRHAYESQQLILTEKDVREAEDYFLGFKQSFGLLSVTEDTDIPSEARVDFFYVPTITACAILHLMRLSTGTDELDRTIRRLLFTGMGRNLKGHGYDSNRYMAYFIELLAYGNLIESPFCKPIHDSIGGATLQKCHEVFTEDLTKKPDENDWGRLDETWSKFCLKLLSTKDSNWPMLSESPVNAWLKRELCREGIEREV